MKDNFDLKKFLTENKAFEQFNPFLAESKDKEKSMRDKIREMILAELELDVNDTTSAYDPVDEAFNIFKNKEKVNYKTVIAKLMSDNKDIVEKIQAASTPQEKATIAKESGLLEKALKAFLAIRNVDSDVTGNMNEFKRVLFGDTRSFMQKLAAGSSASVYENTDYADYDEEEDLGDDEYSYFSHFNDLEDTPVGDYEDYYYEEDEELDEAKKDDEETVDDVEVTDTEEFQPDAEMDPTAGLAGDEKEIMTNLETALEFAKQKGDEKLVDQIGNTITFFTRQYIVK
jgi:hypothetical protein